MDMYGNPAAGAAPQTMTGVAAPAAPTMAMPQFQMPRTIAEARAYDKDTREYLQKTLQNVDGGVVYVTGQLEYSHLAKLVEGEELTRLDSTRKYPVGAPYADVTLSNANVNFQCAGAPNAAETFLMLSSRFYTADDGTFKFTVTRKNKLPDIIHVPDPVNAPTIAQNITLAQDIEAGANVQLVCRLYHTKKWNKTGVSLDAVIIYGGFNYRENSFNGTPDGYLSALGLQMQPAPQAAPAQQMAPQMTQPQMPVQQAAPQMAAPAAPAMPAAPASASCRRAWHGPPCRTRPGA